jgi:hypothetical protein
MLEQPCSVLSALWPVAAGPGGLKPSPAIAAESEWDAASKSWVPYKAFDMLDENPPKVVALMVDAFLRFGGVDEALHLAASSLLKDPGADVARLILGALRPNALPLLRERLFSA